MLCWLSWRPWNMFFHKYNRINHHILENCDAKTLSYAWAGILTPKNLGEAFEKTKIRQNQPWISHKLIARHPDIRPKQFPDLSISCLNNSFLRLWLDLQNWQRHIWDWASESSLSPFLMVDDYFYHLLFKKISLKKLY